MTQRIILILISLCISLAADAAMVRVVGVEDGRTIVVERDGKREPVTLAGVEILDEPHAHELLSWTLSSSWVLLERTTTGEHLVYRSPDALFVNRELVLRGYARATLQEVSPERRLSITYLGQFDPPTARPIVSAPESRTRSGTGRRSPARPSRSKKPPKPTSRAPRARRGSSARSTGS